MMKRMWGLLILVLVCVPMVHAQECAAFVQDALAFTNDVCGSAARNQACYGNVAIDAIFQDDTASVKFDAPGDIVDVSTIQTLNLSALTSPDEWGVALLSLQADLPDTIPGQNVTVLLFGGTSIETAGAPQLPTISVSTDSTMNIRSGPGTNNRVVAKFNPGETLSADGQNTAGDWLRVVLSDGANGWVASNLVNIDGDVSTLQIVETTMNAAGITYAPMQAFYFTSGVGTSNCTEAPQDGILIQTPEGVGQVSLLINEVSIELGSTAYVRAQKSGQMTFDLLEGSSTVRAGDKTVKVLPGTRAMIPLDAEGKAAGEAELTTIPDEALTGLESVVDILPEKITIATPLTQAELDAATQIALPEAGTWITTDVGGGSYMACVEMALPPQDPIPAELIPTDNGFTLMYETPVTFVGDGSGVFTAESVYEDARMSYVYTQVSPDLMTGTALMELSDPPCSFGWEFEITRQK